MISVKNNLNIVRASAGYDLLVMLAFVTPWTATWLFEVFAALSQALQLTRPTPSLEGDAMLLANLLGSVVVVWSLWRLRNPRRSVGLYDALARLLFTVWQVVAVAHGASFLVLGFTVMEVVFGIAQVLPIRQPPSR